MLDVWFRTTLAQPLIENLTEGFFFLFSMSHFLRPVFLSYRESLASSQLSVWRPLFLYGSYLRSQWWNLAHRTVVASSVPIFLVNLYMFFLAQPKTLDPTLIVPYLEALLLWWALPHQGLVLVSSSLSTHPGEIRQIDRMHTQAKTGLVGWTLMVLFFGLYWLVGFSFGPLVGMLFLLVYPLLTLHLEQSFTGIALDYMSIQQRPLREGLTWCFRLLLLGLLVPSVEGLCVYMDWAAYTGPSPLV